ncbi:unnamed protein product [Prorocentrum cordatum]|uniref:Holocytochrome c-type synthase n=1 Tax=Prorocentrum cordatum TaxID=2364126 RepID=A0ABN9UXA9_9DINO|nr:unnamed protein product [Polarella glacialis]
MVVTPDITPMALSAEQHASRRSRAGLEVKRKSNHSGQEEWPWSRRSEARNHTNDERSKARHEHKAAASVQASEPQPAPDAAAKDPEPKPTPYAAKVSEPMPSAGDTTGRPTRAGCWMKMLSGCPKMPMKTQTWRRDTWAEQRGLGEGHCLRRKRTWDKYCEADDAEMLYISNVSAKEVVSAMQLGPADDWPKWPWSRGSTGGGKVQDSSTATAGAQAPVADSAVVAPTTPGCYMRMPSGCPKHPMRTTVWRSDQWAEQSHLDEAGCMQRKITWDSWCGAEDAQMTYVPDSTSDGAESGNALQLNKADWPWSKLPKNAEAIARDAHLDELMANPSEPGCWMRMPSGCPKHPMNTHRWRHDTWAEQQDLDEGSCKERKQTWDRYCGSDDAKVFFFPKQ